MFDGVIPDISGDGKSDMLDTYLYNQMINDTEDMKKTNKKPKQAPKPNKADDDNLAEIDEWNDI